MPSPTDTLSTEPITAESDPTTRLRERAAPRDVLRRGGTPLSSDVRGALIAGALAVFTLALLQLSRLTFVDPDVWHEMALARQALQLGAIPLADSFAYTPTVYPIVHHEWGTGFVLYGATALAGGAGLMALKYALIAVTACFCVTTARQRQASWTTIVSLAPLAVLLLAIGMTTVRAQLFTLAALAIQLSLLEQDRRGARRWMLGWLPLYVVWLNLHAGFIVGAALFTCYVLEQAWRRQPVLHLVACLGAMALLIVVNPYGAYYYPYLLHGILLDRPLISEWAPLWQTGGSTFALFLVSLALVLYTACVAGPRRLVGLLLVAVAAYAALRHTRHVSLYAVVWFAYAPSFVDATSLGATLATLWQRRAKSMALGGALMAGVCGTQALAGRPWEATLPADHAALVAGQPVYPLGAVDYLAAQRFHGHVMVPFVEGGYVMWKLGPETKVSLDGRYEVSYQPGVLEENVAFYRAQPGWRKTLAKYSTDIVLVPRHSPLAAAMPEATGWHRVYRDEIYELYARPGLPLTPIDRRGESFTGAIP
ncbi:MAG: hypothetical protein KF708_24435 [Pirellulales bacterium]|nr:hypothetical protein [Pirellulales bacterium]